MWLDYRLPVNVSTSLASPVGADVGFESVCPFFIASSGNAGLYCYEYSKRFLTKVSGTFLNGTAYSGVARWAGDYAGNVSVMFAPPATGTYTIRVAFEGMSGYTPCEASVVLNATVKPVAILFSVSPSEFEPGASVVLNATILHPGTNERFRKTGYIRFSSFDQNNDKSFVGRNGTVDGVALLRLSYPAGCALAFVAELEDFGGEIPQGICSIPVQLTVATETKLLLNVTNSGSHHTFRGWLKRTSNGEDVSGQTVALKVNETAYVFSTTGDGGFNTALDLKPLNNKKTTFVILVGYDSSTPLNVMA